MIVRTLQQRIEENLFKGKAIIVIGARQVPYQYQGFRRSFSYPIALFIPKSNHSQLSIQGFAGVYFFTKPNSFTVLHFRKIFNYLCEE